MSSSLKFSILCIFMLITLICCEKLPDSPDVVYNFTHPKSQLTITLADSSDTLKVWGQFVLKLKYDLHGQKYIWTNFLIDGNLIHLYNDIRGGIYLDSRKFTDGAHSLVFVVTSKAVTDGYPFGVTLVDSIKKILLVDNSIGNPANIDSVGIVNGVLRLRWTLNSKFSFQQYSVIKNGTEVAVIDDPKKNYWNDKYYYGGKSDFKIKTMVAGKEIVGDTYTVNYSGPSILDVKEMTNNKQAIRWHAYKFFSNFKSYELKVKRASRPSDPWLLLKDISSVDDTVLVTDAFPFGDKVSVRLETKFKNSNTSIVGETMPETVVGFPMPTFDQLKYIPAKQRIYLIGMHTTLLDATTMETVASSSRRAYLSDNGEWAVVKTRYSYFATIDPATLKIIAEYYLHDYLGYESNPNSRPYLSNDGKFIFLNVTATYESEIIKIDIPNNILNAKIKTDSLVYALHSVNQDGSHVLATTNESKLIIYHIQNNNLTDSIFVNHDIFLFYKSDQFLYENMKDIEFYNLADYTLNHILPLDQILNWVDVDPDAQIIYGAYSVNDAKGPFNADILVLYDMQSGKKLYEQKVFRTDKRYWFAHNKIFSADGYYLPITF